MIARFESRFKGLIGREPCITTNTLADSNICQCSVLNLFEVQYLYKSTPRLNYYNYHVRNLFRHETHLFYLHVQLKSNKPIIGLAMN